VILIVVEDIGRHHFVRMISRPFSRIGIDIEERKIATGNIDPNAMSLLEAVGDPQQINRDFADFPRLE
jgi:hypothetical protein